MLGGSAELRRRFFVDAFDEDRAVLAGDAAYHLGRVLRAEPGQLYELSDGTSVRLGKIEFAGKDRIEFSLVEPLPGSQPLRWTKHFCLAIVKFDMFEWAIEKGDRTWREPDRAAGGGAQRKRLVGGRRKARRTLEENPVRICAAIAASAIAGAGAGGNSQERICRERIANKSDALRAGRAHRSEKFWPARPRNGYAGDWTGRRLDRRRVCGGGKNRICEASLGNLILRTETAVTACLASVNFALEAAAD